MPQPYVNLPIGGFTKVNESIAPDKIAPTELTYMTDMVLSKAGSTYNPTKRGGFRGIYNSSSQKIGARPYWADIVEDEVDGKIPMAVGYTGSARVIKAYYAGVWNTVKTLPSGANTSPVRYTRFNKKIFMTDLNSAPFTLEDANFATSNGIQLETPNVNAVAQYYASGSSYALAGSAIYSYILVYADEFGNFSEPSRPIIYDPHITGGSVSLVTNRKHLIANLTPPTDTRVTRVYVFRTKEDGTTYGLLTRLKSDVTHFVDDIGDDYFDDGGSEPLYTRIPTKSNYVTTHRDRIWWADNTFADWNPYTLPYMQVSEPPDWTGWLKWGWTGYSTSKDVFYGKNIASATAGVSIVTIETSMPHGFVDGQSLTIWGSTGMTSLNGTWTITYIDATKFSVPLSTAQVYTSYSAYVGAGLSNDKWYRYRVHAKDKDDNYAENYYEWYTDTTADDGGLWQYLVIAGVLGASSKVNPDLDQLVFYRTQGQTSQVNATNATLYYIETIDVKNPPTFSYYNDVSNSVLPKYVIAFNGVTYNDYIWYDNTPDASLTVAYGAPTAKTVEEKSRLVFSEVAKPNSYLYGDNRPVDSDNSGTITGIFDDGNGLVIFKQRAIYKIFTSGSKYNWELIKLVENIGCTDPYSLAKAGSAYFFRFGKTFYVWQSGAQPQEISKDIKITTQKYAITYASVATERFYAVSAGYNIGVGVVRNLLLYDFAVQCWYNFPLLSSASGDVLAVDKFADPIYGTTNTTSFNNMIMSKYSGNDGYLVKYDEANTQDELYGGTGVDFTPSFTTKKFIFPDEFLVARLRELFIKIEREGSSTVTVYITADDGAQSLSFTTGTGSIYSRNISDSELHRCRNLQINVSGIGLKEFKSLRLDYRPERREYGR